MFKDLLAACGIKPIDRDTEMEAQLEVIASQWRTIDAQRAHIKALDARIESLLRSPEAHDIMWDSQRRTA